MQGRRVFQMKVTLRGLRPPIWRRFLVPEEITLHRLHKILQVVMGWTDSHLHEFQVGNQYFGTPDPEFGFEYRNDKKVRLREVVSRPKDRITYVYDFGDGWVHDVVLEKIMPADRGMRHPVVLAGRRSCPPEDVGGIGGYSEFLQAISDPDHPEHGEMTEWWGGPFDPEAFDICEVNLALRGG